MSPWKLCKVPKKFDRTKKKSDGFSTRLCYRLQIDMPINVTNKNVQIKYLERNSTVKRNENFIAAFVLTFLLDIAENLLLSNFK